jgi:hypothetical protein
MDANPENSCWSAFNAETMTSFHSAADNLTPPPQDPSKYKAEWPSSDIPKAQLSREYSKVISKAEKDLKDCDLSISKLEKYRKSIVKALRDLERVKRENDKSGR